MKCLRLCHALSVAVFLPALTLLSSVASQASSETRDFASGSASPIVDGRQASTSQYPWMARVEVESADDPDAIEQCGGSLIARNWILTAAHCFLDEAGTAMSESPATRTTVVLRNDEVDAMFDDGDAEILSVRRIIIHPDYNPDTATSANVDDADLALVELESASSQTPVTLIGGSSAVENATVVTVAGWGKTADDGETSNMLLAVDQQVMGQEQCSEVYMGGITANMLCAGGLSATDTGDSCQGDSGGPLFLVSNGRYVQVGIVSFGGLPDGPSCGNPAAPGVYTRVSRFAGFISEKVPDAAFATLETRGLDSLPRLTATTTSRNDSQASFAGGLTRNDGQSFETSASSSERVRIMGNIRPLVAHQNRRADIFVVDKRDGVFYMKTPEGTFERWLGGRVANLVPARENVLLSESVDLEVHGDGVLVPGEHRIFFGYMLVDGDEIHYNFRPVIIDIF